MGWRAFCLPVEGAQLAGEVRDGEGTPLVLVHGFGGSRAMWDAVIAALPADLPLVRYDLRGFGASAQDEAVPFRHADDLLAVLDHLGIAQVHLCGLSMGGAIAVRFAIERADRVARLVLVSPALIAWEWSADWAAGFRACVKAARSGDMATARRLWWENPLFDTVREEPFAAALQAEIAAFAGRQWMADPQMRELPEVEHLHRLTAPTLLLAGGRDTADFRLIADMLSATVPDLRRIDYPDAGHMLTLERPADLAGEIAAFLGGRVGPPRGTGPPGSIVRSCRSPPVRPSDSAPCPAGCSSR
ncbi:MAG TPA: alpha/beta fold hydrolase [Novosphingobium sp.]|nr:alpha/beta fold hydrolase [Novosphingobium sp.]